MPGSYQLAPKGWRRRVLLAAGYVFFYLFSGTLLVYLLGTTLLVHCIGIWLEWLKSEEKAAAAAVPGSGKKGGKSGISEAEQTGALSGDRDFAGRAGISEIL